MPGYSQVSSLPRGRSNDVLPLTNNLKNFGAACPKIKEFYDQLRDYEMFKDITASSDLRISWLIFVETCLVYHICLISSAV